MRLLILLIVLISLLGCSTWLGHPDDNRQHTYQYGDCVMIGGETKAMIDYYKKLSGHDAYYVRVWLRSSMHTIHLYEEELYPCLPPGENKYGV